MFTLRSQVNSLSQVTPQTRMASAASTVIPTWISVLRLNALPRSHLDRALTRALDELPHHRIPRAAGLLRRSLEYDPPVVQHRDLVADLVRARQIVRHHHRGDAHALLH